MAHMSEPVAYDWGYGDIRKVTRLISSADDVKSACEILARHLRHLGLKLISVNFTDLQDEYPSIRPYRDMPDVLVQLSNQFCHLGGCPIIKHAKTVRRPFDALKINRAEYAEFSDQRFLDELGKLGHRRVLVLPVTLGRGLANFVIGTGDKTNSLELQAELFNSVGQSLGAIIARFPEITKLFETKTLSTLQAEILFLISIGTDCSDIARHRGLGEFTINALVRDAQMKLAAKSVPQAVAKALALGEFSNMNIGDSEILGI